MKSLKGTKRNEGSKGGGGMGSAFKQISQTGRREGIHGNKDL